jgi:hypothetical protein
MDLNDKLPNGAVYIFEQDGVIFAERPGAVQPWVTWLYDGRDYSTTVAGQYYGNIGDAVMAFHERVERENLLSR